jgi:hypothetical protein
MTEEPDNKYGSFYGNPGGVLPGMKPPKQGPDGHPCATLFSERDESDGNARRGGGRLFILAGILLLLGGAAAAFVAMGGRTLLSPRAAGAAVAPETSKAIDEAKSQVTTLRRQLAKYHAEHDRQYPTLGRLQDEWAVMLQRTYADGSFVPEKPGRKFTPRLGEPLGPYLQEMPVNPLTHSASVVAAGQATPGAGWTYDESNGALWAVAPADIDAVLLAPQFFEIIKPAP